RRGAIRRRPPRRRGSIPAPRACCACSWTSTGATAARSSTCASPACGLRCRRPEAADDAARARLHPAGSAAGDHPAGGGAGAGLRHPARGRRHRRARRGDRGAQRADPRGLRVPAPAHRRRARDRVRDRPGQRRDETVRGRRAFAAAGRRPARLPRSRRPAPARIHAGAARRRAGAGGRFPDGRRRPRAGRRAAAGAAGGGPARARLRLSRVGRGRQPGRMAAALEQPAGAAAAGARAGARRARRLAGTGGRAAAGKWLQRKLQCRRGGVAMKRMRGAALLLVMWLVLLLSGLVAGYAMAARIESLQGNGAARGLVAGEAARAGLEYAVARMLDPDPARRWAADGRAYRLPFDGVQGEVGVRDGTGKVHPHAAPVDLLASLFARAGAQRDEAPRLAGAVADWRDPDALAQPAGGGEDPDYAAAGLAWGAKDAPFESVAELEQVLGMRPALYAALAPHLTVHSGRDAPDADFADPLVRAALGVAA